MSPRQVIQFMHPGREHVPDSWTSPSSGWKDWNRCDHKRKFLRAEGAWTADPKSRPRPGPIAFWGEWEPQSDCTALPQSSDARKPRWLHHPRLDLNAIATQPCAGWQNTDPLVFGDMFRYAICRQFRATLRRTKMSYLSEGDIILFGSHVGGEFVLDTVFVVNMYADVIPGQGFPNWETALHREITMKLVKELPAEGVRLYGGQTWTPAAPFSFVPCVTWNHSQSPFARPRLQPLGPLSPVIRPGMKQGFKITTVDGASEARAVWEAVVGQVLVQGCVLGTTVEEPARADPPQGAASASRATSGTRRSCSSDVSQ